MYAYYWASAMRVWPKRISPMFITVLQLLQMAGGVWCCAASAYYKRQAAAEPGESSVWSRVCLVEMDRWLARCISAPLECRRAAQHSHAPSLGD